ncbi:hypothetical protein [Arthrobacter methylotrophus]|uniref:Uncharacterized protein n=1 Tax=Arthrobacter methylotrophus TaxID=121291 RepID=A0ABV5UMJ8_9MICC
MTQRSSARLGGAPRAAVRRPFSVALTGMAMAMMMCAFPLLSAHAETVGPPGQGQVSQSPEAPPAPSPAPVPAQSTPAPSTPVPPAPVVEPVQPALVVPVPAAPVPMTQVTVEPEPSVATSEAPVASSPATPSDSPTTSSASPSASSNWNTPIQDGLNATQAASVSGTSGPGSDMFAVVAIMGGVLLVAAGGIAFALWSRHRFSH